MTLLMFLALAKAAALLVLAIGLFLYGRPLVEAGWRWLVPDLADRRVECAWCQGVIRRGSRRLPTSHGCCETCSERLQREAAERHQRRRLHSAATIGGRGANAADPLRAEAQVDDFDLSL